MSKLLNNVELSWAFLNPEAPQENFERLQWSITASVSKDRAMKFKRLGYIKSLRPVESAEGHETGNYKITFKQNAETNAGKKLRAPGVFTKDAEGNISPLKDVIIGNGSIGTISFTTYNWSFRGKEGVSMALKNVLVTELVPYEVAEISGSEFGNVKAEGDEFNSVVKEKVVAEVSLDLDEDDDF